MHNIVSVRQGRVRPSFIWAYVILMLILASCTGVSEPEATAVVARETATSALVQTPTAETEPTEAPAEKPTAETTQEPAPEPTAASTEKPTTEPVSIPQKGQLTLVDEVTFEVLAQYGGLPSAVAVAGGVAYVGMGPRLMTLDVSDPDNPVILGESELLADSIDDIAVVNGIAYLAAGRAGLAVVDATEAANPLIVNEGPNYAGANQSSAETIQIDGNIAFLTDYNRREGETSLLLFDISDPANVLFLNALEIQVNDSLAIDNGRLVITGNGRIEVRETADPGTIQGQASLAGGDYSSQVVIQGDTAFVVETGVIAGVEMFDISNIENPRPIGEITPVELFIGTQVAVNETTLFSVGTFGEFGFCDSQIDVIDIGSPVPVSITRLSPEICVTDLVVDGSLLYVSGRNGLKIFDVTDPEAIQEGGLFVNPDGIHNSEAVALYEDVTYILTGEGSGAELRVLDLMEESAELYNEVLPLGMVLLDLFVIGDTLVAPQWQGSLFTFDLVDPTTPQILFAPEDAVSFNIGDILSYVLNGNVIYLPIIDGSLIGGVGAVDLSDPANPQLVSTVSTGDYTVMHMAAGSDYLYVLGQGETFNIHIIDISDPLALELVGKVAMPESTNRLGLIGDTLYAACDGFNCQSLYIVDVTDPTSAEITGRWQMNVGAADLVPVGGDLLLMPTFEEGIFLLDVSDLDSPSLTGRIHLPGEGVRVKVQDGLVYATAFDGGLYVLSIE